MSKFLYPIYKLKTKSYIKWWLYHKKAGGSGTLSEILEGFSFNLENTLNRKFKLFEIEGNSVQDGTPSPDNEVPIYSAGDDENIIDINRTLGTPSNTGYDNTNKRTFDVTTLIKFLTANNYYNAGVQIDYSLIDNGIKITTKQAGYGIGFPVILSSAKTYTISANIDVIDNQMIRAIFYKEDGTYISNVTSSGTNKFLTFTTTDDTYFVVIMLTPKANVETTYSEIKLEKGNKASGYSPYGMGSINEKIKNADGTEEQDYSIFVQQPMRSIGDVRDCFVKVDGNWYERHYIGEVIFDGSENWSLAERSETSNGVFYIENFLNTYGIIREQCLSNYGTYVTGYSNKVGQFDIHYSQLRFYAYNNTATINDWKNKLTEKNLVINGFLAEPLDLPCTPEQIDVLENLPSTYKDFTIINSEDETPAHLKIQYYKEG